jgi:hypothetical protein
MVTTLIVAVVVLIAVALIAHAAVKGQEAQAAATHQGLVFDTRASYLKGAVERWSGGLFDSDPGTASGNSNQVWIEGKRAGTPLMLTAAVPAHITISASELVVTAGLRGATPRFYLLPRRSEYGFTETAGAPITDADFFRVWDVRVDPSLDTIVADQEVRRTLMRLFLKNRTLGHISVTPHGLSIHWTGQAESAEEARVVAAADVAIDLQRRILDRVERRVRVEDVNIAGGYRGEPLSPAEVEEEEEGNLKRSSASQD